MMQFADQFTDQLNCRDTVTTIKLVPLFSYNTYQNTEAQLFYANQVRDQLMSVRDLRKQIATKAFERTTIANIQTTPSSDNLQYTFKDPYLLDFLNLGNAYLEKDLEQAILDELEKFILELGKGFTFVERQKRMIIDGEDLI
jgi:predicted nuclease of restriction endonuclease-like (RecB) superfamily